MELVEDDDVEAETATVLDELDEDRVDRLVELVLTDDVLLLLDVLADDPDTTIVDDEDELLAEDVDDEDVEADDVLDVLAVLWLEYDCVDALEVEVLDDDFPTSVEVVLELDPVEADEVEVDEVDEVDSEEYDFVDDEDELDIET